MFQLHTIRMAQLAKAKDALGHGSDKHGEGEPPKLDPTGKRRDACIIIEANKGDRAAARSLVRRAIKEAGLKVDSFVSGREAKSYGITDARFTVSCTDEEMVKLREIGNKLATAEGWDRFPVDTYHD